MSDAAESRFETIAVRGLLVAISVYKVIFSQLFAGSCRFVPSCSSYAADAIRAHGAMKGTVLALARLARCHPFCEGGVDPVPPSRRVGLDGHRS